MIEITEGRVYEISLVKEPANPECVILWVGRGQEED